ncbi:MAG: hypothetical protein CMP48_21235 [Rickettsiales bacterium]|nr:hypothetical protein [Rickettsiales bacterium]
MKNMVVLLILLAVSNVSYSQIKPVGIEKEFEELTAHWHQISDLLSTYNGLSDFCVTPEFRNESIKVLSTIHHIDSLILDLMHDPTSSLQVSKKEREKTIDEIEKFEQEYGIRSFIEFLKESCLTRNELEANAETLKNESGMYSYDGQVMMLETRLSKYLKHLTKKVDMIAEHIHHIHPDQLLDIKLISQNI